jgi:chromosome partitioning protein
MPVVVSFISQKGGVGKSTLARALLAVAARVVKARLADLDPEQASVVAWERTRTAGKTLPSCDVVAHATIGEAVAASGDIELLIVDTPGGADPATLEVARHSHLVVQPTGASADDLVPAILTFHELVKAGIASERLVMAIARVLSAGEVRTVRAYVGEAGYEVLNGAIFEKIAYREAQNRGHAITETKVAKLNSEADALMEALLYKIAGEVTRLEGAQGRSGRKAG